MRGVWDCLNYVIKQLEKNSPDQARRELLALKRELEREFAELFSRKV